MPIEFRDPFLTEDSERVARLRSAIHKTDLPDSHIDGWFSNFKEEDKPLALRILENIHYWSSTDIDQRLEHLGNQLPVELGDDDRLEDALVVLPDDVLDSATHHAYHLAKLWRLDGAVFKTKQVLSEMDLRDRTLVFFNDTHGTGNQFISEFGPWLRQMQPKQVAILALVMAAPALAHFKRELPGAIVIPRTASRSAMHIFSAAELKRIRELGKRVYPEHPLGYGDCGLLVAYHYQCPNNTLPLIWADGTNNIRDGGAATPWKPLFPYRPKIKPKSADAPNRAPLAGPTQGGAAARARPQILVFMNPDLEREDVESLTVPSSKTLIIESPAGAWHKNPDLAPGTWGRVLANIEAAAAELRNSSAAVVHLAALTPFSLGTVIGNRLLGIYKHRIVLHQRNKSGTWRAWAKVGPRATPGLLRVDGLEPLDSSVSDVRLYVEITWSIADAELPGAELREAPRVRVSPARPGHHAIEDGSAARRAAEELEDLVQQVVTRAPKATLHVFYAGPYSVLVLASSLWDKLAALEQRPRVVVYERRGPPSASQFWPAVTWPDGALADPTA